MLQIPKIVRQRLANAKPGAHPDADLLTAFAEQLLSVREQDSILQHLSQCAECREVVLLATPQEELKAEVVPARSSWLGWPALRWGALAACAVIVVGAVSLRQRSTHMAVSDRALPEVAMKQPMSTAAQNTAIAAELDKDRVTNESRSRADVVRPDERIFVLPPKARAKAAPLPSTPSRSEPAIAGALASQKAAPRDMGLFAKSASASTPPAQASEQVTVMAESSAVVTDSVAASPGKAKESATANLPAENKVAKFEAPAALGAVIGGTQAAFKKITPRWTLSADGTLQRSLDAGKTWKTIPVAADATLTAVAAMDSNIWVGGSHGALYHSTDAGDHWTQVTPASAGQSLTSNVIGIEFIDALHGKITTADQEVWTTADGGQSWQVLR